MEMAIDSLAIQVEAQANEADKYIDKLAEALTRLKSATSGGAGLNSVNTQLNKLNSTSAVVKSFNAIEAAIKDTSVACSGLNAQLKNVSATNKQIGSIGKSVGKSIGTAFSFTAITAGLKTAFNAISGLIEKSTEYIETANLFKVSMGEYAAEAKEYADIVSEAMGIDPAEWMRAQGVFMTLGTGFGVTADRAVKMSKNLTQLGYDLSSFFNISVEDSMQKLQSGISGELEPLRRLGYDLSQARLEAVALSLGIDKTVSSMTQAEKAELRYVAIMSQVKQVQGDMARTLEDPANQLRIFEAQVNQTGRALGNIFIPALNAALPYVIAFVKVVGWAAQELAALFNLDIPQVDFSDASNSLNDVSGGFGGIEDAASGASGAAKELKKQLAGFDELNVLSAPQLSGGGGAGGGFSGSGFGFDLPEYDFLGDALNNRVNEIANTWRSLFEDILKTVVDIGLAILAWKISKSVLSFFDKLEEYGKGIKGMILITLGAKWSWDAGYDIGRGTASVMDYIKAVLGPVTAGVGGYLIAGSAGLGFGLTLGITLMFVGMVAGAKQSFIDQFYATEAGQELAALKASIEESVDLNLDLQARINSVSSAMSEEDMANLEVAKNLINEIFTLDGIENKSAAEIELLNSKVEILNGMNLAGIQLSFDETTGKIKQTKSAVMQTIEELRKQYQLEAAREAMTEAYKLQFEAMTALNTATNNATEIRTALTAAQEKEEALSIRIRDAYAAVSAAVNEGGDAYIEAQDKLSALQEEMEVVQGSIEEYEDAYTDAKDAMLKASSTYSDAVEKVGDVETAFSSLTDTVKEHAPEMETLGEEYVNGLVVGIQNNQNLPAQAMDEANKEIDRSTRKYWDINSPAGRTEDYGLNMMQGLGNGISENESYATDALGEIWAALEGVWDNLKSWWSKLSLPQLKFKMPHFTWSSVPATGWIKTVLSALNIPASIPKLNVSWYASGGFPEVGELFVARESGPEMVGRMGSSNVVANNDQIVSGIAEGVYRAFMRANGENGGSTTIIVRNQMDSREVSESVFEYHNGIVRQTGVSPLLG